MENLIRARLKRSIVPVKPLERRSLYLGSRNTFVSSICPPRKSSL